MEICKYKRTFLGRVHRHISDSPTGTAVGMLAISHLHVNKSIDLEEATRQLENLPNKQVNPCRNCPKNLNCPYFDRLNTR